MLAIPGADTIGEVTKDGETYICPVTVSTKEYADAYSVKNGEHTAVAESVTYNMIWNENGRESWRERVLHFV